MPALTRRRDNETAETWHIYYGDIQIGTIGLRSGVPKHMDPWGWSLGFFPRSHRGAQERGTAASFNEARGDFERAWERYLTDCTAQDFLDYRRHRDWTAWKYRMREEGCKLPTETASGRSTCWCGAELTLESCDRHVYEHHVAPAPEGGP